MSVAAVALGSNLGDRAAHLAAAIAALRQMGDVLAVSSFYDTEPVDYTDQPRFLNAAALLQTSLQPLPLLAALLQAEQAQGRDRGRVPAKGPRTLDLDLLLYDDVIMDTAALVLPHPAMHCRAFVLQPLAEIAPHLRHPVLLATVRQLLDAARVY